MRTGISMWRSARATATTLVMTTLAFAAAACGDDDPGADSAGPPAVSSFSPEEGDLGVWIHDTFTVTFTQPLDPATVNADTVALRGNGADLEHVATLSDDGLTLTVRVTDEVAHEGDLVLVLSEAITDLAGQPLVTPALEWRLAPWSVTEAEPDDAEDATAPSIAIAADGAVLVAWQVDDDVTASHLTVQRLVDGTWERLGGPIGDGAARLPSISLDTDGNPVIVWTEGAGGVGSDDERIESAYWDGVAWARLPSPGDGHSAVLAAMPGGGDPVVAWVGVGNGFEPAVNVSTLDGAAWAPYASSIALTGTVVGVPALALATATSPVVGLVEKSGNDGTIAVRVLGWTGLWNERPPIRLAPPALDGEENRMALAVSGTAIYVAWDEDSGHSYSVHVAQASAGAEGWTRLGGALDIDPPADARAPSLVLDADGAPTVAWQEQIEGNERGFVSRWDGAAWQLVGGDTWTTDPAVAPVRPTMALWRDRVPVVAWATATAAARLALVRFNGPASPRFGLEARASTAGCAFDPLAPPTKLSLTGCFTIVDGKAVPHPGLVPFDLVSELWSDGALKRRWILLADGAQLTTPSTGAWTAPVGTVFLKEFAIETSPGNPSTRRVMETRFLVVGGAAGELTGVQGFSYQWRVAGDDADLLPDEPATFDWALIGGETHTHSYPSRQQCLRCHGPSNGPLLGPRTGQLARRVDYGGVAADQLATLAHIGVLDAMPAAIDAFAAPHDPRAPLEQRVRGYLASNCAHCHNPTGERPTRDFRWETPMEATGLCTDSEVVPGSPQDSMIYQRVTIRPGGMPPLATLETDGVIIDLLEEWIGGLATCP